MKKQLWIIDGHEDLAWNIVVLGREETAPLAAIRAGEGAVPAHGEGTATLCLPALRVAGVRVVFATIFAPPRGESFTRRRGYRTPEEANRMARAQLNIYHQLQAAGEVSILRTRTDFAALTNPRTPGNAPPPALPGLALLMEGAEPILSPAALGEFQQAGVWAIGLSWQATRYAAGSNSPGPLTEPGVELLREMERLGLVLDASHLAEEAFWQAMKIFHGRVIASHANCRALVPTARQLSDDMLRAIAERDGVIGLVFYNSFIRADWQQINGKDAVCLADLLPHVQHIEQLIGIEHVALGTDLDGGVGREVTPAEIDSVLDLPRLAEVLASAGYAPPAIAGIMHANWSRVLQDALA